MTILARAFTKATSIFVTRYRPLICNKVPFRNYFAQIPKVSSNVTNVHLMRLCKDVCRLWSLVLPFWTISTWFCVDVAGMQTISNIQLGCLKRRQEACSGNLDPNYKIHYLLWEPVWRWPRPSKVGMNTYVVCRRNCGMKPAHDRKLLYVTKEGAPFKTAAKTCTACGYLPKHNTSYVAQQWEKSHLNTVRFYSRTYTHTQKKKKKKKCTSLVSLTFLTESPAPTRHEKYSQNESLLRSNKT